MNCDECKERRVQQIPYIAYEAECARHDRNIKRLIAVIVLVVLLLVASNLAWLYVWQQYDWVSEDESIDISTRGGGNASYIGNDGDINNYGDGTSAQTHDEP